ncbi:hypothetical protein ACJ73_01856 [Blastomyces percursus]|uniref:Uncharacterized protein n=1 Tax=Blastomyces percursus TaxID=1658174 RepID=A0A1J9RDV9_9EURO|nr:hypothetical protein ACJ73_01856 [Blastomyces percursus]
MGTASRYVSLMARGSRGGGLASEQSANKQESVSRLFRLSLENEGAREKRERPRRPNATKSEAS